MNRTDLAQIGTLIEEKLEPIKKTLGKHDEQFKLISIKLSEHSSKLDSLTLDMIEVQRKTDSIRDIHALVKDTREVVKEHDQRINILESSA